MSNSKAPQQLQELLAPLGTAFAFAVGFSVFVNLMLLGPTLYMLQVFDRVLSSRSEATLLMLSIGVAIALVAMAVVDAVRSRLLVDTARRIDEILGPSILRHVLRLSSSPAPANHAGALRDVATLRGFCSGNNIIAVFDAPWMIVFVVVIFFFHPAMGALALAGALLLMLLAWFTERTSRAAVERHGEASRRLARYVEHGLRNADVVNGMGMADAFASGWDERNRGVLDLTQAGSRRSASLLAAGKFLRQAIQAAMMGVGAWLVLHHHVTPGIMIAATILFGRAMAPVELLIGNWQALINARAAWRRLTHLVPAAFADRRLTPLPEPVGRLQAERVALAGSRPDSPILRQVDVDLPAGRSLGILGPSGAGKSSLAKILLGVWAPTSGKVRIDGAELGQWDRDRLGRHFGYLPQDVELLPGTVAENIARFRPDAGSGVIDAARRAHVQDMIVKLPGGFDTLLGDGGIRLSAGQAQRVGLARALFGQPKVVILDEPNANLDSEGEAALLQTLGELRADGVTIVMVTHKPSLVASLDYLMVLRDGRVELLGPRDEVLARLAATGVSPVSGT